MLKSEFLEKASKMKSPRIREFSPDENDSLLMTCWVIEDVNDIRNKFCTPSVKLLVREYWDGNLDGFYSREKLAREKYERWLSHLTQRAADAESTRR